MNTKINLHKTRAAKRNTKLIRFTPAKVIRVPDDYFDDGYLWLRYLRAGHMPITTGELALE